MNFTKIEKINCNTEKWMTYSKSKDLPYVLSISHPKKPAPPSGYPIIYVLDGNAFFQSVEESIRLQSRRADKTNVQKAIVVGIGYPTDDDFDTDRRFYDFTPSTKHHEIITRPNGDPYPENGGADIFINFLKNEVIPFIVEQYHVDQTRQILFGHSLGGLFVLHTLFNHPDLFQSYIASSPSIWWNKQAVLENESGFVSNIDILAKQTKLFLTIGSLETADMITNVKQLSERLSKHQTDGFRVEYHEADGENHISVVPTTLSRALRFVFHEKIPATR